MKILLISLLLYSTHTYSQVTYIGEAETQGRWGAINNKNSALVKGTTYLFDKWIEGKIKFKDGMTKQGKMKYDIFNDQVHFLITPKDSVQLLSSFIKEIDFNITSDSTIHIWNFDFKGLEGNVPDRGYYQVLYDDSTSLVVKRSKKIKRAYNSSMETIQGRQKPDEYIRNDKYFIIKNGKSIHEVFLNKKSVSEVFKDKQIDLMIETKKLKLKREQELVDIIIMFNSLY